MGYRKITVDNQVYEYVIGKHATKIKGLGVFQNVDFGSTFPRPAVIGGGSGTFVTPGMVSDLIRGKKPRPLEQTQTPIHECEHGVSTPFTAAAPYDQEIYGEHHAMIACARCLEINSWDI